MGRDGTGGAAGEAGLAVGQGRQAAPPGRHSPLPFENKHMTGTNMTSYQGKYSEVLWEGTPTADVAALYGHAGSGGVIVQRHHR
jgi:hypothetical protein